MGNPFTRFLSLKVFILVSSVSSKTFWLVLAALFTSVYLFCVTLWSRFLLTRLFLVLVLTLRMLNSSSNNGPVTVSGPFFSICMATLALAAFEALVQWCETVNYVPPSSRGKHDGYIVCIFPNYERFSYWYDLYGKQSYLPFVHVRLVDDSVFVQVTCLGLLMSFTPQNKWHVSTRGKLGIAGM